MTSDSLPRISSLHWTCPYREILEDFDAHFPSSEDPDARELAIRALRALEFPRDFATRGSLYVTHVPTVSESRDADALESSNYHVISLDLLRFYGDTVSAHDEQCESLDACECVPDAIEGRVSHWAVGWVDTLEVRPFGLDDSGAWTITDAFRDACSWSDALEDYPVADDEDFSAREHEELTEYLTGCENVPDFELENVTRALFDVHSVSCVEDIPNGALEEIAHGIAEDYAHEITTYYRAREMAQHNGQLTIFGDIVSVIVPNAPNPERVESVLDFATRQGCEPYSDACEATYALETYLESVRAFA